jgi:Flagellar hook-length control protein FliK
MIPSAVQVNSKTSAALESATAQPRLVVVSLQVLRDALIKTGLPGQADPMEVAKPSQNNTVTATVVARTQLGYVLRIGTALVELDLLGEALAPGTELRLRLVDAGIASPTDAVGSVTSDPLAQLSSLGRLLNRVVTQGANEEINSPLATMPLAVSPEAAGDFVQALRETITSSGLFYESHLKDWVGNQRPLSEIRQEPQGRLEHQVPSFTAATSEIRADGSDAVIPENLIPIVQRQLNALESHAGIWRTEVWPGQFAQLAIEQETSASNSSEPQQTTWRASLKMQLPQLGTIDTVISLVGNRTRIEVKTAELHAEKLLMSARANLVESLGGIGLVDAAVAIEHDTA